MLKSCWDYLFAKQVILYGITIHALEDIKLFGCLNTFSDDFLSQLVARFYHRADKQQRLLIDDMLINKVFVDF